MWHTENVFFPVICACHNDLLYVKPWSYYLLLIETQELIAYPLLLLFNQSLRESSVPQDWKQANVTPIFKHGNRNKVENYRPVSLTSLICKIFKSIICDTIMQHLESQLLINSSQHAFHKGRSCLTNLLEFLDKVISCIDSGDSMDVIFLDFANSTQVNVKNGRRCNVPLYPYL